MTLAGSTETWSDSAGRRRVTLAGRGDVSDSGRSTETWSDSGRSTENVE